MFPPVDAVTGVATRAADPFIQDGCLVEIREVSMKAMTFLQLVMTVETGNHRGNNRVRMGKIIFVQTGMTVLASKSVVRGFRKCLLADAQGKRLAGAFQGQGVIIMTVQATLTMSDRR